LSGQTNLICLKFRKNEKQNFLNSLLDLMNKLYIHFEKYSIFFQKYLPLIFFFFKGIPSSYTNGSALMGEQQEKEYPGEMYDEEVYFYPVDEVIVEDCCPASVYKKIPCCEGTNEIL
jgi:hypothetical protein